jgi:hypothetical protein
MSPGLQDFGLSVSLDCGLLRASLAAGEEVALPEIMSLAAAAEAIYLSATLESRQMNRVRDCHALWSETARLFEELSTSWADTGCLEPQITWLQSRISHFAELCRDRQELYTITQTERQIFANGQKGGSPPKPENPVKEFSPKEVSRINNALDRRLRRIAHSISAIPRVREVKA